MLERERPHSGSRRAARSTRRRGYATLGASRTGATSPSSFASSAVFAAVFVAGASCAAPAAAKARSASPCVDVRAHLGDARVFERLARAARRRGPAVDLRDARRAALEAHRAIERAHLLRRAAATDAASFALPARAAACAAIARSDASGSSGSRLGPAGRSKNASLAPSRGARPEPGRPRCRSEHDVVDAVLVAIDGVDVDASASAPRAGRGRSRRTRPRASAAERTTTIARDPSPRGHALPISANAERGPISRGARSGRTTAERRAPGPPRLRPAVRVSAAAEEDELARRTSRAFARRRQAARSRARPSCRPRRSHRRARGRFRARRPRASSPFVCHEVARGRDERRLDEQATVFRRFEGGDCCICLHRPGIRRGRDVGVIIRTSSATAKQARERGNDAQKRATRGCKRRLHELSAYHRERLAVVVASPSVPTSISCRRTMGSCHPCSSGANRRATCPSDTSSRSSSRSPPSCSSGRSRCS